MWYAGYLLGSVLNPLNESTKNIKILESSDIRVGSCAGLDEHQSVQPSAFAALQMLYECEASCHCVWLR